MNDYFESVFFLHVAISSPESSQLLFPVKRWLVHGGGGPLLASQDKFSIADGIATCITGGNNSKQQSLP